MALSEILTTLGDNLKGHPLALAMILLNVIVLYILWDVAVAGRESNLRKDNMITQLIATCQK